MKNNIINILSILLLIGIGLAANACYSFKSIGIPPDMKTFQVFPFDILADNVVPTLPITFTERLKDKILQESRLTYVENDPDVEFRGSIQEYDISAVAPEEGETTALNRLEITVMIDYLNNLDENDTWKSSFSYFNDFGVDENLLDIQDELIENINEQLVEDIFNKAFGNW